MYIEPTVSNRVKTHILFPATISDFLYCILDSLLVFGCHGVEYNLFVVSSCQYLDSRSSSSKSVISDSLKSLSIIILLEVVVNTSSSLSAFSFVLILTCLIVVKKLMLFSLSITGLLLSLASNPMRSKFRF